MIYLIEELDFTENKDGSRNIFSILKIGYTDDNNIKQRFNAYTYHCPGARLIHTIPGATCVHEKSLHVHFKKYKYGKLDEWFYFNLDIVNSFKGFTLKDLDNIASIHEKEVKSGIEYRRRLDLSEATYVLRSIFPDKYISKDDIFNRLDPVSSKADSINLLRDEFGEDVVDNLLIKMKEDLKTIKSVLDKLRKLVQFTDKLRAVCDIKDISILDTVLKFIPIDMSSIYITLGPDKCRSKSYRKCYLEYEYNKMQNNNVINLDNSVYSEFKEGTKVAKAEIKASLQNIYDKNGYKNKAKASDLEYWFELKYTKAKSLNGKWENGFELVKKKK